MKKVIDMAREAGLSPVEFPTTEQLVRFDALVRADEREAVIEWVRKNYQDHNIVSLCETIRAGGNK